MRITTLVFSTLLFSSNLMYSEIGLAKTPDNRSCSDRYDLAWEMPLKKTDIGRPVRDVLNRSEFFAVRNVYGDRDRLSIGRAPDGTTAMQMNIKKGENRPTSYVLAPFGEKGVESACLALRIYFDSGFEWARGGGGTKLGFGLWGGQPTKSTGGTTPVNQLGWTVRNVNSKWGVRLYSYHLNRPSRFGQQGGAGLARWGSADWRPGQWHDLEVEVVMNDPGLSNGFAQMWLNGHLHQTMTNLRFSHDGSWLIRGLWASDMWGGNYEHPDFFSPKAQKMWYANYKLYTKTVPTVAQHSPSTDTSSSEPASNNTSPSSNQSSSSGSFFGPIAPSGTVGGSDVTVEWRSTGDADRYYVKVVDTRSRSTVFGGSAWPNRNCSGLNCNLDIGKLSRGQYEWMVRPVYGSTAGNYSRMSFTVDDAKASSTVSQPTSSTAPSSTSSEPIVASDQPASGDGSSFGPIAPSGTVGGSDVTVEWRSTGDADRYYVKVVDTRSRSTVFGGSAWPNRNCSGLNCNLDIGKLSRGQYKWMVRPVYGSKQGAYATTSFIIR